MIFEKMRQFKNKLKRNFLSKKDNSINKKKQWENQIENQIII